MNRLTTLLSRLFHLPQAIWNLTANESEWRKSLLGFATRQDLALLERHTMSTIKDFADKQVAFNERQDAAIAAIASDIQVLNDTINTLQNSAGTVTTEDQALLDQLTVHGQTVADKLDALDALNQPKPPVA